MTQREANRRYYDDLQAAYNAVLSASYDDFTIAIKGNNRLPFFLENFLCDTQWHFIKKMLLAEISAKLAATKTLL
jgi:hypothetical protein